MKRDYGTLPYKDPEWDNLYENSGYGGYPSKSYFLQFIYQFNGGYGICELIFIWQGAKEAYNIYANQKK